MKYGLLSLRQVARQVHIIAKRVCSEKENCFKVKDIVHRKFLGLRTWHSLKLFALNGNTS